MLSYLSKTSGIGGILKATPEDFKVEEISEDGSVLEIDKLVEKKGQDGKFTHFVLQKTDWTTADALREIGKKLGISHSRFNFAGTKDKRAITTQLVSAFSIFPEQLFGLQIKDIKINGAWQAKSKVELGSLLGNRFKIRVEGSNGNKDTIEKIYSELGGKFPNYFGAQRFGSTRKNTHLVGEKLLRGDIESAVMDYLTNSEGEENKLSVQARKDLSETMDFAAALKLYPRHLKMERSMLAHLSQNPTDFIGALKRLPRNILMLFIHAFQSQLFNELVSSRLANKDFDRKEGEYFCGESSYGFPDISKKQKDGWLAVKLIGYETFDLSDLEYDLLEKYNIMPRDFKIKAIPEISSKGTYRTMFSPLRNFEFDGSVFKFSIPSGSYATVALREFLDKKGQ